MAENMTLTLSLAEPGGKKGEGKFLARDDPAEWLL